MKNFRTLELAIDFYQLLKPLKLPRHLKDQLLKASSSVSLNLAEGSAKPTKRDQLRFYNIAFGSLRECQAILRLEKICHPKTLDLADHLGASLYKLARKT